MIEIANHPNTGADDARKQSEGPVAKKIEQQTAKIPSDVFLWAAVSSIGLSLGLRVAGMKEQSQFVGHWTSPLLILGLYNKLVKVAGSDRADANS